MREELLNNSIESYERKQDNYKAVLFVLFIALLLSLIVSTSILLSINKENAELIRLNDDLNKKVESLNADKSILEYQNLKLSQNE